MTAFSEGFRLLGVFTHDGQRCFAPIAGRSGLWREPGGRESRLAALLISCRPPTDGPGRRTPSSAAFAVVAVK